MLRMTRTVVNSSRIPHYIYMLVYTRSITQRNRRERPLRAGEESWMGVELTALCFAFWTSRRKEMVRRAVQLRSETDPSMHATHALARVHDVLFIVWKPSTYFVAPAMNLYSREARTAASAQAAAAAAAAACSYCGYDSVAAAVRPLVVPVTFGFDMYSVVHHRCCSLNNRTQMPRLL